MNLGAVRFELCVRREAFGSFMLSCSISLSLSHSLTHTHTHTYTHTLDIFKEKHKQQTLLRFNSRKEIAHRDYNYNWCNYHLLQLCKMEDREMIRGISSGGGKEK
jgi:hypothetical protein